MPDSMKERIDKMFSGDKLFAWGFVIVLWVVVIFVFIRVNAFLEGGAISTVLICSAGLVLLFNTAAIVAMIRHYSHEKDFIYGLDIRHLDVMKAKREQK